MSTYDTRSKWAYFVQHETVAIIKAKVTKVGFNDTGKIHGCVKVEAIDGKIPERKLDFLHFSSFNLKNTSQLDMLQELLDTSKLEPGHIIYGSCVKEPDDNVKNSQTVNWLYILDGIYLQKKKQKHQKPLILAPAPTNNAWNMANLVSAPDNTKDKVEVTEDNVPDTNDDPSEEKRAITLSTEALNSELQKVKQDKLELKELYDIERSKYESLKSELDKNLDCIDTYKALIETYCEEINFEKEQSVIIKNKLLASEEAKEELHNSITIEKDKCIELEKKLTQSETMKLEIDTQNKLLKNKLKESEKLTSAKPTYNAKSLIERAVNSTLEAVKNQLINERGTDIKIDPHRVVDGISIMLGVENSN